MHVKSFAISQLFLILPPQDDIEYSWSQLFLSKQGSDVELQNQQSFLFRFCHVLMQVTTLITRLGLETNLVDSYRDATSVAYGHLPIDMSAIKNDELCYCTNNTPISSNNVFQFLWSNKNLLMMNKQHLTAVKTLESISCKCKKTSTRNLSKSFFSVSMHVHNILLWWHLQSIRRQFKEV